MKKLLVPFVLAALPVIGFVAASFIPPMHAFAAPPDLNATATSAESLVALVTTYGWVGALGLAYVIVRMLLKANDAQHWVAQGKVLAYVTAGVGVLGTALQALLSGSPWTGVLLTAVLAVVHLVDAGPPSPAGKTAQGGFVARPLLLGLSFVGLFALAIAGSSCSKVRPVVSAGAIAALDCEAAHLDAQALADAKAFASAKVQAWLSGSGSASSAAIKADLAPIKSDLGRCAIAGALAMLGAVATSAEPGVAVQGLMASPEADPAVVRTQFSLAARQLGWPPVAVGRAVL